MAPARPLLLISCLALPLAVGAISGFATASGVREWYPTLEKPSFTPPDAVFGPVWTLLYFLMGVGLYLVVRSPAGTARTRALWVFGVQLTLNALWSFLFFAFHRVGLALVDILFLWAGIVAMLAAFLSVHRKAGWLQAPYLLWVSFATALNASIWMLNRP